MKEYPPNHYEMAFSNWLIENQIEFISTVDQRKPVFEESNLKSFDFLLCPCSGRKIIAEVKGRHFRGAKLQGLSNLECWVTTDDIDGLSLWKKTLGCGYDAAFIFAYKVQNIDVDFDGREIFEFGDNRYFFFAVLLEDYIHFMKQRSPKWRTVTLPADKFRCCAKTVRQLLA